MFFTTFLAFAFWAYVPANKKRMEEYGQIPLEEKRDGE
jgi:cbb3-type cytochrome oxidase subunit 3